MRHPAYPSPLQPSTAPGTPSSRQQVPAIPRCTDPGQEERRDQSMTWGSWDSASSHSVNHSPPMTSLPPLPSSEIPLARKPWTPSSHIQGLLWSLKATLPNRRTTGTQGSWGCSAALSRALLANCSTKGREWVGSHAGIRSSALTPPLCPSQWPKWHGQLSGVSLPPAGPRQDAQPHQGVRGIREGKSALVPPPRAEPLGEGGTSCWGCDCTA